MYTDIDSFEKACALRKYDPTALPIVDHLPEHMRNFMTSTYKLAVINEALNQEEPANEPWKPDYENDEARFYPWFKITKGDSGVGLSFYDFGLDGSLSLVGSRLCLNKPEKVQFSAETFPELHLDTPLMR